MRRIDNSKLKYFGILLVFSLLFSGLSVTIGPINGQIALAQSSYEWTTIDDGTNQYAIRISPGSSSIIGQPLSESTHDNLVEKLTIMPCVTDRAHAEILIQMAANKVIVNNSWVPNNQDVIPTSERSYDALTGFEGDKFYYFSPVELSEDNFHILFEDTSIFRDDDLGHYQKRYELYKQVITRAIFLLDEQMASDWIEDNTEFLWVVKNAIDASGFTESAMEQIIEAAGKHFPKWGNIATYLGHIAFVYNEFYNLSELQDMAVAIALSFNMEAKARLECLYNMVQSPIAGYTDNALQAAVEDVYDNFNNQWLGETEFKEYTRQVIEDASASYWWDLGWPVLEHALTTISFKAYLLMLPWKAGFAIEDAQDAFRAGILATTLSEFLKQHIEENTDFGGYNELDRLQHLLEANSLRTNLAYIAYDIILEDYINDPLVNIGTWLHFSSLAEIREHFTERRDQLKTSVQNRKGPWYLAGEQLPHDSSSTDMRWLLTKDIRYGCFIELSNPIIEPVFGFPSDDYYASITYTHAGDVAPQYVNLQIDDSGYPMQPKSGSPYDYIQGVRYSTTVSSPGPGSHVYWFEASDGTHPISTDHVVFEIGDPDAGIAITFTDNPVDIFDTTTIQVSITDPISHTPIADEIVSFASSLSGWFDNPNIPVSGNPLKARTNASGIATIDYTPQESGQARIHTSTGDGSAESILAVNNPDIDIDISLRYMSSTDSSTRYMIIAKVTQHGSPVGGEQICFTSSSGTIDDECVFTPTGGDATTDITVNESGTVQICGEILGFRECTEATVRVGPPPPIEPGDPLSILAERGLAWSDDGTILAGVSKGTPKVQFVNILNLGGYWSDMLEEATNVHCLRANSAGDKVAVGQSRGYVAVVDIQTGSLDHLFDTGSGMVNSLDWLGSNIIVGRNNGDFGSFTQSGGQNWVRNTGIAEQVNAVRCDGSTRIALGDDGGNLFLYSSSGSKLDTELDISLDNQEIWGIAWSPDKTNIAVVGDGFAYVYDVPSNSLSKAGELRGHSHGSDIWSVEYIEDKDGSTKIATGSHDGTVKMFPTSGGDAVGSAAVGDVRALAWHPERKLLAASSSATQAKILDFNIDQESPPYMVVSPTGLHFPNVMIGDSRIENFYITNTGGGTVECSVMVTSPFSILGGSSYSVHAGESVPVMVELSPSTEETFTGNAMFTDQFDGVIERSLTGNGIPMPEASIVIDPDPNTIEAPWLISGPDGYISSGNGDICSSDLEPGDYTLTWEDVDDWIAPSPNSETKTVSAGSLIIFSGTYSEYEGPPSPPGFSFLPGCFIATAAYDSPMADEIQILREFRDEYLLTNPMGKALVEFYYRVSPSIAEFIIEHPSLKPIVRVGLLPAVTMSTLVVNATVAEKIAIAGLFMLVLLALAAWARRQPKRGSHNT